MKNVLWYRGIVYIGTGEGNWDRCLYRCREMKRLLSRVGILLRVGIKDMTTNHPLQLRMKFTRQGRISMNVRHQLNSRLMVAEAIARRQAVVGQLPVQVFMILMQKVEVIECCLGA